MKQTRLDQFWKATPTNVLPSLPPTQEESARESLEPHYIRAIPEDSRYRERLEEEYQLIDKNKFARVFLQVKTILSLLDILSKETGKPIPHIIRGSAGSSLVCYLLGITQIDPIRYGIELARFMNRCRTDIPDIDIDVPYNRREEIYAAIASTWKGQVGRVSNHVCWKTKTATREAVKQVLQTKESTKEIESAKRAVNRRNFKLQTLLPQADDQETARELANSLKGTVRHMSKHCGGIVVFESQGAVPEEIILKPLAVKGETIAQLTLNKDQVEDEGFIKIDVLSNRGLAQLAEICPTRPFAAYPTRDAATERIFSKGLTIGVTFGESRGMRRLFMEMQPRNVEEIAIALALIRPAAASDGRKTAFLEKWAVSNGQTDCSGLLRPIIFDDDAIVKVRRALQCDAAEADRWRKAFAKGNAEARVKFRQALQERGIGKSLQDSIIDDLEQLMLYSFCKSHAISYAQLVWALAYWKSHHPHAFWCASLNHCHSEYRKWVHYREAFLSGLQLSRSPPPYEVGTRNGRPALIPTATQEQSLLVESDTPEQAIYDMRMRGYWLTTEFLPSCGVWPDAQLRMDGKRRVRFCGIIATGRVVQRNGSTCTLLCIGTANHEYTDIVIPKQGRSDLFRYSAVEGTGLIRESASQTIDVLTIRGKSLRSLMGKV